MENLIQIVAKLKQPELRMLKSYYRVKQNKEPSKKLELLNIITSKKAIDDKAALKKLYDNPDGSLSAFSHLKERLKADLLNSILFIHPEKMYKTAFAKKKLFCRKAIIQAELLMNRGNIEIPNSLLLKALSIAQTYDFPYLEIQIRDILRGDNRFNNGFESFKLHNQRIEECFKTQKAILKAKEIYLYTILTTETKVNTIQSDRLNQETIAYLKKLTEETNSVQVKFWYYLNSAYYHMTIKSDYAKGIQLQKEFIQLVENEVALRSNPNIGGTNMQLAHAYIITKNYKEALPPALKALKCFTKKSFNYLRALEMVFWVYLRSENYEEADDIANQAFKHPNINQSPYFKAKWNYLKANMMFIKGNLSAAHSYLLESDELNKDKTGWLIGFKLLLIYITFEQGNYYWLSSQLENFRKLIQRNKEASLDRVRIIHKISYALLQSHGDFKKVEENYQKELTKLREAENKMYWDPTGYEIVRFDDWFQKRCN